MSVRECLEFAAKLKLSGTLPEKLKRVTDIITELRLQKCQHTKIGGHMIKGVSGGERKRTSIGVELITDPMLIFLDEPTTGLDSFTAMSVVETMRELALSGRTIVSTIHQPSSETFETFDRLMLMCLGKIIYMNDSRFAVDYFTNINYPCPDQTNPADFFMSIMSRETHEDEVETENNSNALFNSKLTLEESYRKKVDYFDKCY
jgi:ABC-type multidrug transport system ATPase subunit